MGRMLSIALLGMLCLNSATGQTEPPDIKQLTDDRYLDGYCEWSPDSKYLIYTSAREDYNLWKIPAEGGKAVKVSERHAHHGRFSPDGKYIAFDGDKGAVVRIMPADGGVPIRVVPESIPVENSGNPAWSPDGEKIAFRSMHALYTLDLQSGVLSKVYQNETRIPVPTHWAKKENCLLVNLINRADHTAQIWKVPLGGGEATQLTFTQRATHASPAPDESCFVYSSVTDDQWDLWVLPFAGGKPLQLTTHPDKDMEPRWSPDGSRIAFTSNRNGPPDLYVMKVDLAQIKTELKKLNEK